LNLFGQNPRRNRNSLILLSTTKSHPERYQTYSSKKRPQEKTHDAKCYSTRDNIWDKPEHQLHEQTQHGVQQQHLEFTKPMSGFGEEQPTKTNAAVEAGWNIAHCGEGAVADLYKILDDPA